MSDAEAASYAFFFKCLDFADADIVIKSTGRPSRNMQRVLLYSSVQLQLKTLDTVLASFPGHRVILDKCPYFAAQVMPSFFSIILSSREFLWVTTGMRSSVHAADLQALLSLLSNHSTSNAAWSICDASI